MEESLTGQNPPDDSQQWHPQKPLFVVAYGDAGNFKCS
jgi:hypothetical protein